MIINILIGATIFGYAGWALVRHINKSKEGKCAACSVKSSCASNCMPKKETDFK
jgi:radical SAM protein with 4Fe4S-binding SPASM domain